MESSPLAVDTSSQLEETIASFNATIRVLQDVVAAKTTAEQKLSELLPAMEALTRDNDRLRGLLASQAGRARAGDKRVLTADDLSSVASEPSPPGRARGPLEPQEGGGAPPHSPPPPVSSPTPFSATPASKSKPKSKPSTSVSKPPPASTLGAPSPGSLPSAPLAYRPISVLADEDGFPILSLDSQCMYMDKAFFISSRKADAASLDRVYFYDLPDEDPDQTVCWIVRPSGSTESAGTRTFLYTVDVEDATDDDDARTTRFTVGTPVRVWQQITRSILKCPRAFSPEVVAAVKDYNAVLKSTMAELKAIKSPPSPSAPKSKSPVSAKAPSNSAAPAPKRRGKQVASRPSRASVAPISPGPSVGELLLAVLCQSLALPLSKVSGGKLRRPGKSTSRKRT